MPFLKRAIAALAATTLAVPAAMAQQLAADPAKTAAQQTLEAAWSAPEPWRTDRFYLQTSVASAHFHPDDEHDNSQQLINAEWRTDKRWLAGQVLVGAASFDNSFGQASWYAYGGLLWRPAETVQPFYLKLTAGVLHGYRGEYQDKIPFNDSGYAPAILPAMGYCYNRFCTELVVFGAAGMMLTVGATLP
ncbi:MAG: hypothetical protein AW10_03959 [Candidatus Accumulibacter appositus]|uniref:Sn-glycerol-3-phosphate transporter n=1 Tax=Candidatus Accumulibacter appositus TaxID=1454003 RepID=A0A011N3R9_9PROT|nr:hypothetical protein [Accumulibacter sp.]EXI77193.1 MAG: hypothetical protein AW10_03959 [Candidatus Accumulibacter appositus]